MPLSINYDSPNYDSPNYDSPRELRAFLDEHGLGMRKKYGQNFLVNPAARLKLIDELEFKSGDEVWEIGSGLGAMTHTLLERGARVTAFEIDHAFSEILRKIFEKDTGGAKPGLQILEGDVFKTWPSRVAGEELLLLGNLPYNIAAALLADFIEKHRFFKRMVVTVQREVALRMAAVPGSPDYSSFSVLCSSVYKVSLLNVIKASSFFPAPRVDSQGVRLDFLSNKQNLPNLFYPLVRALFSSRRKTLKNTLTAFASSAIINRETSKVLKAPEQAALVLKRAGIEANRRAETLSVGEFAALALFLEEIKADEG